MWMHYANRNRTRRHVWQRLNGNNTAAAFRGSATVTFIVQSQSKTSHCRQTLSSLPQCHTAFISARRLLATFTWIFDHWRTKKLREIPRDTLDYCFCIFGEYFMAYGSCYMYSYILLLVIFFGLGAIDLFMLFIGTYCLFFSNVCIVAFCCFSTTIFWWNKDVYKSLLKEQAYLFVWNIV